MATIHLTYAPNSRGEIGGWYLPCTDVAAWLSACADEPFASTEIYLAPRSVADSTVVGLIALRRDRSRGSRPVPPSSIPLTCIEQPHGDKELWMPLLSDLSIKVPRKELFASLETHAAKSLVWLTPDDEGRDRLISVSQEDAVDLSVLIKPPARANPADKDAWSAPPIVTGLPPRATGLEVSHDLISANPFTDERQSIGGQSDELMSLDDRGEPEGGNLGSKIGRMFRNGLSKIGKSLNFRGLKNKEPKVDWDKANAASGASPKPAVPEPAANKQSLPAKGAAATLSLFQHLHRMLEAQREKQLKKLLRLLERDPDRALKYAIPLAGMGAPRGLSQPGSTLGANQTDFSLSGLFGGGRPVDNWSVSLQTHSQLIAAYRAQAEREVAAGRYRRAAYIYAHLMGDMPSAAMVLEKGKFFIEAAALFKLLVRPLDQARCLRHSGQLAEAAAIYEEHKHFETAAEMWQSVGDDAAAKVAYQRACDVAIESRDVLKAVQLMEQRLDQADAAEQLLWQQWPGGHQVFDCTKLAFKRLAEHGRTPDAHRRFNEIVARSEPRHQTLLAQLCADLHFSYPDRELRIRAEDQCRRSFADGLDRLHHAEFDRRMQILSGLHTDDLLLQRDVRRYQRERANTELIVRPEPSARPNRKWLYAIESVRLSTGQYRLAKMVDRQLFTISRSDDHWQFSRYADLLSDAPKADHCSAPLGTLDMQHTPCCHIRDTDPLQLHIGYAPSHKVPLLLSSPLGGDNFWIINTVAPQDGLFIGFGDDGAQWYWKQYSFELVKKIHGVPMGIEFRGAIRAIDLEQDNAADEDTMLTDGMRKDGEALGVICQGQPVLAYGNTVMKVKNKYPVQVAQFPSTILWMAPSLSATLPRVLVATNHELYLAPLSGSKRPEKLSSDEHFTHAAFLPGGNLAATTHNELILFRSVGSAMQVIDRQPTITARVVAILSLSMEVVGVLYEHGVLQRYRIKM